MAQRRAMMRRLLVLRRMWLGRPIEAEHDDEGALLFLLEDIWRSAGPSRPLDTDDEEEQLRAGNRRRARARRRMLMALTACQAIQMPRVRASPKHWVRLKDPAWTAWWDRVWRADVRTDQEWNDRDWLENFRMKRASVEMLMDEIKDAPCMQRRDTRLRGCIPLEKRVAVALWRLANGVCTVRQCRQQFGMGRQSAWTFFWDFCEAVETVLQPKYIYFPETTAELEALRAGFQARSGGYRALSPQWMDPSFQCPRPTCSTGTTKTGSFRPASKCCPCPALAPSS